MDLWAFDYMIMNLPGKWNIADYLSWRHALQTGSSSNKEVKIFVKSVVQVECCHMVNDNSAVTVDMVREATENCELMGKLNGAIFVHISASSH